MNKEILYKGVNTTPSANMSVDGDTSMLYNLIPEDNAIKPIIPPKELAHFDKLWQVFICLLYTSDAADDSTEV